MFFRRPKEKPLSFSDHLARLREFGFRVQEAGPGRAAVLRGSNAAVLEDVPGNAPRVAEIGARVGNEIGVLTHGGYQMFFKTRGGRKEAALAEDLRQLHDFREDLTEALDKKSYYNTSLGTICGRHQYDRLVGRDEDGAAQVHEAAHA